MSQKRQYMNAIPIQLTAITTIAIIVAINMIRQIISIYTSLVAIDQ